MGLRPGTVPAPLTVGFGTACQLACERGQEDAIRMSKLTVDLRENVHRDCPDVRFFGDIENRLPGNLCMGFPGITADEVIEIVSDRIAISTGSACSSGTAEPSRVLLALGLDRETASTGIRVSLGRFTTDEEIAICGWCACKGWRHRRHDLTPCIKTNLICDSGRGPPVDSLRLESRASVIYGQLQLSGS